MKLNQPTAIIDDHDVSHGLENSMNSNQITDIVDEFDLSYIDPATISVIAIALFFIPLILSGFLFQ